MADFLPQPPVNDNRWIRNSYPSPEFNPRDTKMESMNRGEPSERAKLSENHGEKNTPDFTNKGLEETILPKGY